MKIFVCGADRRREVNRGGRTPERGVVGTTEPHSKIDQKLLFQKLFACGAMFSRAPLGVRD